MWSGCIDKLFMKRNVNDSREDFVRFHDNDEYLTNEYERKGMTLLMSPAKDPIDIIWLNMGGTRGIYFCRRWVWNILGLLLIIFVSTPAVIFKTMQSLSQKHLDLQFLENIPYVEHISTLWPTLIILLINMALILLIDHSAITEKHSAHSTFQNAIFNKAVVYLHLNMVFFPFLSLQGQPVFKILEKHSVHVDYIKEFTMINSSTFFVNLIIQYAVFTG